jgi:hypothetical protein
MIRKISFLFLLPLFFLQGAIFGNTYAINSTSTFSGDSHGEFFGNSVTILSDGSAWKVHPDDELKYSLWLPGETVHPQVRTSFYWFKREHKFELQNLCRNESIRVMLVQYPTYPLYITHVDWVEHGGYYTTHKTKDASGNSYSLIKWNPLYLKNVYLNDGSIWHIVTDNKNFKEGKFVYSGIQTNANGFEYFLIAGTEREAVWTKVKKIL